MHDDTADFQRDQAPTGDLDAALPGSRVVPLSRLLGYRIAEGDPDVRGWEVRGADGLTIGVVEDLLVDTRALKARYLKVVLEPEPLAAAGDDEEPAAASGEAAPGQAPGGLGSAWAETLVRATLSDEENELTREHHHGAGRSRHVLIPIGFARLDPKHDRILVEGLRAADAAGLPDYHGQPLDAEYEAALRRWFDRTYTHAPERDFYAHEIYDEDRFYDPRRPPSRGEETAETARAAGLEPGSRS